MINETIFAGVNNEKQVVQGSGFLPDLSEKL